MKFDQKSTRVACGETISEIAVQDERVVMVAADTARTMGLAPIMATCPERVIDVGIAEQCMMMVAAGAAAAGQKAVAATYAPFTCMRALEQLRTFIAYPNLDVKIIGGNGGLSGSIEGVTHQGQEDINIMRTIPNLVVLLAADEASARVMTRRMMEHSGPVYLGLGRSPEHTVFDESYSFEIGKGNLMRDGKDVTLVASGTMVYYAKQAAALLEQEGIDARLIEIPCIKPIDTEILIRAARETKGIVTVEDRNILGGMGSAVSEVLCEHHPAQLRRIGVRDVFTESAPQEELYEKYGMCAPNIAAAARELLTADKTRGSV